MTIKSGRPDIDFRPNLAKTRYFPTVMTSQWPKKLFFVKMPKFITLAPLVARLGQNSNFYYFWGCDVTIPPWWHLLLLFMHWWHPGLDSPHVRGSTPYRSLFCPRGGGAGSTVAHSLVVVVVNCSFQLQLLSRNKLLVKGWMNTSLRHGHDTR